MLTRKTLNSVFQTGHLQVTQDLSSVLFDMGLGLSLSTLCLLSETRLSLGVFLLRFIGMGLALAVLWL